MRSSDVAAPDPDHDLPPAFMAAVYGWMSAGLVVTATACRHLGENRALVSAIARHGTIAGLLLLPLLLAAAVLWSVAMDLGPAAAAVGLVAGSAGVGLGTTLLEPHLARALFIPLLVAAGAHALLALYVGATRRPLEDLGPAVVIVVAGLLLSSTAWVRWHGDVLTFFGTCIVLFIVALVTALGAARLNLFFAARPPTKPPVGTIACAVALSVACVMYLWVAVPGMEGYQKHEL